MKNIFLILIIAYFSSCNSDKKENLPLVKFNIKTLEYCDNLPLLKSEIKKRLKEIGAKNIEIEQNEDSFKVSINSDLEKEKIKEFMEFDFTLEIRSHISTDDLKYYGFDIDTTIYQYLYLGQKIRYTPNAILICNKKENKNKIIEIINRSNPHLNDFDLVWSYEKNDSIEGLYYELFILDEVKDSSLLITECDIKDIKDETHSTAMHDIISDKRIDETYREFKIILKDNAIKKWSYITKKASSADNIYNANNFIATIINNELVQTAGVNAEINSNIIGLSYKENYGFIVGKYGNVPKTRISSKIMLHFID